MNSQHYAPLLHTKTFVATDTPAFRVINAIRRFDSSGWPRIRYRAHVGAANTMALGGDCECLIVEYGAFAAMTGRIGNDSDLLREVVDTIVDPMNSTRLMGTVSVAHIGLKHLLEASESTRKAALELLETWPVSERNDLIWFLKSAGVQLS